MIGTTPIDIAVSFLSEDERLAKDLANELEGRVDVFFYADRQGELVGTDGEESFGEIFRDRATLVVIFYRPGWGDTVMTRAEKSAIKQRGAKEGYGFSVWVPIGPNREVPPFIDPQHLWYDLERWGITGLAAVVEQRLRSQGKKIRPKTAWDKLKQLGEHVDRTNERKTFRGTPEGLQMVNDARNRLNDLIRSRVEKLDSISPHVGFQQKTEGDIHRVFSHPFCCVIQFDGVASNTAISTRLMISLHRDQSKRNRESQWTELAKKAELTPSIDDDGEPCWETPSGDLMSLETALDWMLTSLGDLAIKYRADQIKKERF